MGTTNHFTNTLEEIHKKKSTNLSRSLYEYHLDKLNSKKIFNIHILGNFFNWDSLHARLNSQYK